jgi:predicted transcriptional regulator
MNHRLIGGLLIMILALSVYAQVGIEYVYAQKEKKKYSEKTKKDIDDAKTKLKKKLQDLKLIPR